MIWISLTPGAKRPSADTVRRQQRMMRRLTNLRATDAEAFGHCIEALQKGARLPRAATKRGRQSIPDENLAQLTADLFLAQRKAGQKPNGADNLSMRAWCREEAARGRRWRDGVWRDSNTLVDLCQKAKKRLERDPGFRELVVLLVKVEQLGTVRRRVILEAISIQRGELRHLRSRGYRGTHDVWVPSD